MFPDVILHASIPETKNHPDYPGAKAGDLVAAKRMVEHLLNPTSVDAIAKIIRGKRPYLLGVYALEEAGINRIPAAMAEVLSERLALPMVTSVVQINTVGHTGAKGWGRIARQPIFEGNAPAGDFVLLDDFIGQGGTLANLRGHVETNGGHVLCATTLTGKEYSAKLRLTGATLAQLRQQHGQALEAWWERTFGFAFDALTESEAAHLLRTQDADTIRSELAKAGFCPVG
jgi:hypothetical protein